MATEGKKHLSLLSLSTTTKPNKKIRKMVDNWPDDGSKVCIVLDLWATLKIDHLTIEIRLGVLVFENC